MTEAPEKRRCGFVAVAGLPNAGKSTLVNALVGQKVSIVSRKVQTTRMRILGIAVRGASQIILMDMPGIFSARKMQERVMVKAAIGALSEADIALHLVDATAKSAANGEAVRAALPENIPHILVLNKTDMVKKPDLLVQAAALNARGNYESTYMVSALKGDGTQDLLAGLAARLPEGEWLYGEDEITDMPVRLMAAEITREKIYDQLHQELPYATSVETESWEEQEDGSIRIGQIIAVLKDSQKGVVVGKGGQRIRQIGEAARHDMEAMLGRRVHLKLFVKVRPNLPLRAGYDRLDV